MKWKKWISGVALVALLGSTAAYAGGFFTNGVPVAGGTQYPSTIPLTGVEQLPADTELPSGLNPQSEAITTAQIANYAESQSATANGNFLIGGDATTNLWQAGTTGSSVTTTATYGGPDQWFYWSGTSTAMTVSRTNTTSTVPNGFEYNFRMQRTASQTGVVQVCMAQEIPSSMSYALQGATVELDFHAYTGANYSPAAPYNMTAYIIYGTGTDDGSVKMAFGLNGGGGGSSAWANQANATAAVIKLGGVSTLGRYAAFATIPAAVSTSPVSEVGVALCYTPVGTAGTTDALYFSGIQLVKNPAGSAYANASVGYSCDNTYNNEVQCTPFLRRQAAVEASLQYQFLFVLNEPAAGAATPISCGNYSSGNQTCSLQMPVPMYKTTPVVTIPTTGTFKQLVAGSATTWVSPTAGTCSNFACEITTTTTDATVGNMTPPVQGNGGSGVVKVAGQL